MDQFALIGTKEDDPLSGTAGTDILLGLKGDDVLDGGAGNDLLLGGKGDDLLDGGADSDVIRAGKGDDTVNFTLSANLGAMDFYDGGKGLDTLQLTLTATEFAGLKGEIDDFEAFLAEGGKVFEFSFGLIVRNFEALEIVTIDGNTAPVAVDDSSTTDEDIPVILDLVANDFDADGNDLSAVILSGPANGMLSPNPDGTITYTPSPNFFGDDAFTYQASDGTDTSNVATVSLTINSVNDEPVAMGEAITETAIDGRIRVAVLGVKDLGTHQAAAGQLDITKFNAEAINYTPGADWTSILAGFEVVVLGENGDTRPIDYSNETATGLFSFLSEFVSEGGGVVTTGWFARALPIITDAIVRGLADGITPIASDLLHSFAGTGGSSSDIIDILGSNHEIAGGLDFFKSSSEFGWELAGKIDPPTIDPLDTDAVLLAQGKGQSGATLPAIAYDTEVGRDDVAGLSGGNTVYLGGMYLARSVFSPELTRTGVLDEIFERAVAWAAGARSGDAAVTVTIDDMNLLKNDTDVDPGDVLAIDSDSFPTTSANGAAISFDANGDIVYTIGTQELVQKLLSAPVDSFEYTVNDGNGGTDIATVNLAINGLDGIFG